MSTTISQIDNLEFKICGDIPATVAYLVIILILCGFGNIFMIAISFKDTNMKGGMLPMIILAIGEIFYVTITVTTVFCVMGSKEVVKFIREYNLCPFLGSMNLILIQFDLATHALLGFIRYFAICKPIKYRKYVNVKNTLLMMLGNFCYAVVMGIIPNVIIFDKIPLLNYTLDPSALNCMMKLSRMASSYICIFYFGPPMVLAGVSYLLVFYKLNLCKCRSTSSTNATTGVVTSTVMTTNITKNQKRLAVTLGTSFLIIFIQSAFYPMSIILFEGQENLCFLTRRHFTWMILHNSLVNPVAFLSMYAYKRKYFRAGKVSNSSSTMKRGTKMTNSLSRSQNAPIR